MYSLTGERIYPAVMLEGNLDELNVNITCLVADDVVSPPDVYSTSGDDALFGETFNNFRFRSHHQFLIRHYTSTRIKSFVYCNRYLMLFGRGFCKRTHKKDKDSGSDRTAHHRAQQGKTVAGSGHPHPQYLPSMLARTYTLRTTSRNVYHP
ncbi:hypothetical protein AVEN_67096-1 [Araneus ventricosus]|uniref:Uncharacterized protein n=1 Tax=Araneus ventricosus TaxID=182803 RepID=A0A4Y2FT87_ARAVE|nr:hypothetical protein AVEN_67096-1 [Araneus ventricosus]